MPLALSLDAVYVSVACGTHGCETCYDQTEFCLTFNARLSECGHMFCVHCLHSWLQDIHQEFLDSHPDYDVRTTPGLTTQRQIKRYPPGIQPFFLLANNLARPNYTCPTCDCQVVQKPVAIPFMPTILSALGKKKRMAGFSERPVITDNGDNRWAMFFGYE